MNFKSSFHKYAFLLLFIIYFFSASSIVKAEQCWVYGINLQGIASVGDANFTSGSQQFSINQYLFVRLSGIRNNSIELIFHTLQDLNITAQIGQIHLLSNSVFSQNRGTQSAQLDLMHIGFENNGTFIVNFQVDAQQSLQLPPSNNFVSVGIGSVPGGLGGLGFLPGAGGIFGDIINNSDLLQAQFFIPRSGGGFIFSPDGAWSTISGEMNLTGSGPDNFSNLGRYSANISGSFLGSSEC